MATSNLELQSLPVTDSIVPPKKVVNDFAINVATVNGSGSQSANSILLRSIFSMGVPVSGKNLFPSNIAGLPTWYTIRVSRDGWVARKSENDLLIAMNAGDGSRRCPVNCAPGARRDLTTKAFKLTELPRRRQLLSRPFRPARRGHGRRMQGPQADQEHGLRRSCGAVALHRHDAGRESTVRKQFAKKVKAAELNWSAVQLGYDYAASTLTKQDPSSSRPMNATARQDHHRRQRRRRHGRDVCRRHGGRLVPHHALVLASSRT